VFALDWESRHLQSAAPPRIVSCTKRGEVIVWCSRTGLSIVRTSGHQSQVMGLARGSDVTIFSASHDRSVKAWDSRNGEQLAIYEARSGAWRNISLSTAFVLRTGPFELCVSGSDGCGRGEDSRSRSSDTRAAASTMSHDWPGTRRPSTTSASPRMGMARDRVVRPHCEAVRWEVG
jgi:WD40 repeat protein